jgi:hypothetical protein
MKGLLGFFIAAFLLSAGFACHFPLTPLPDQAEFILAPDNELDYYELLRAKPRASMADAARLVVPLTGEAAWGRNPAELRRILLDRGAIEEDWEISETAPLTRGKLAFMICRAADIESGVFMRLGISSERYALREAVFHDLMTPSSTDRYVPGSELLDILAKTRDFVKRRESEG